MNHVIIIVSFLEFRIIIFYIFIADSLEKST